MAHIQTPILPLYLYRYRSLTPTEEILKREIAAIKEPYLWCGDFNSLNDPMEGFYRPSSLLKNKSDYAKIARIIIAKKTKIGIASFSDTKENELMWTHYAGNYSGLCIEYHPQRLLDSLPPDISLVHLGYGDAPPRVSAGDTRATDLAARKILSQKKFNWAYEREWRVLAPVGKLHIGAEDVVRSIYLGSRIADGNRRSILTALRRSDIRIYEMDVTGYEHEWRRIDHPVRRKRALRNTITP